MTNQQLQYLMQLYGGNQVASNAPSAANTPPGGLYPGIDFDPNFEPSPIPTGSPFNLPHQGMDVPPGVYQGPDFPQNIPHQAMDFYPGTVGAGDLMNPPSTIGPDVQFPGQNLGGPGWPNDQFDLPRGGYPDIWDQPMNIGGDLPPSPGFAPSDYYLPNDYGPATVMSPPPAPYDFSGGPDIFGQVPVTPMVGQMPGDNTNITYQPPGTSIQDFGGPPLDFGPALPAAEFAPPEDGGFPAGGIAQTEGDPDFGGMPIDTSGISLNQPLEWEQQPGDTYTPPGTSGVGPGVPVDPMTGAQASGGVPYGYPGPGIGGPDQSGPWVEHNPTPWYPGKPDMIKSADANVYGTPPEGGFHPGQMIKDAAGNFLDATGKIVMTAAQAVGKLPGEISDILGKLGNNIMNDPRNTDPQYLASMGYHEMGPEGSGFMIPGGVSGPSVGAFDTGTYGAINAGSYFHGGASAGMQHGATPVAGAFNGLGAGPSPINLGATSMGNVLNRNYLLKMYKGLYTPGGIWGMNRAQSPSPWAQTGGSPAGFPPPQTFAQFHQGQVNLGNILRSNPSLLGGRGAAPPNTNLRPSIHFNPKSPV